MPMDDGVSLSPHAVTCYVHLDPLRQHMHIYIYIYIYTRVYIYIPIYIYILRHVGRYTYINASQHIYIYIEVLFNSERMAFEWFIVVRYAV